MIIRPIKTEAHYEAALVSIEALFNAEPNTDDGDQLDVLTTLVEVYEAAHYPVYPPDPVEAIRFHLEQNGLSQSDIAGLLGGRNRVSEVLHRKRPLTLAMVRSLHRELGIPAESLLGAIV
jgi:HTH-type transcriptional regulator / antitoxin HigA